jgi:NAD(P)-dependent dehydrogenase (short-subunit alcohol dehydrogenase family)
VKVAVVTGAAGGIGRAVVERLVDQGWQVVAVDVNSSSLEALDQPTVLTVVGDIRQRSTHVHAAERAHDLGTLAGWVNCAAVQIDQSATDLDEESLRRQLEVNLIGSMWGCAEAVRNMPEGGSIVSLSSIHALHGFEGAFAYAATKGGINAMSRQLAVEYGPRGIRANTVLPGAIMTTLCTDDWARSSDPAAARASDEAMHLQNRMGEPREVAAIVAFLLSEDSSLINGQEIVADGGATARRPKG